MTEEERPDWLRKAEEQGVPMYVYRPLLKHKDVADRAAAWKGPVRYYGKRKGRKAA